MPALSEQNFMYTPNPNKEHILPIQKIFNKPHNIMGQNSASQLLSHRFVKPRPFVVGGFVGSKSVECKNIPNDYSDLINCIFNALRVIRQTESCVDVSAVPYSDIVKTKFSGKQNFHNNFAVDKSYAEVARVDSNLKRSKTLPSMPEKLVAYQSESDTVSKLEPTSSQTMAQNLIEKKEILKMEKERNESESSESSWGSVGGEEERTVINPWLKEIIGSNTDCEDSDTDSDWDCVEDIESENGEIVDTIKWHGDSLSPIPCPTPLQNGASSYPSDDYDSDDSEGILISCDDYDQDDEESIERKLIKERIRVANATWQIGIEQSDQIDGLGRKRKRKKVNFAPEKEMVKVHPMITWSHAYRAARKGKWEELARDSERFREHIKALAAVLEPVLNPVHRKRVWGRLNPSG